MFCINGNVLCLYSQYVSHLVICGYQTLEIWLQQVKNGTEEFYITLIYLNVNTHTWPVVADWMVPDGYALAGWYH